MKRTAGMPSWVFWGLWGTKTRGSAMGCYWFALFAGIVSVVVSFTHGAALCGAIMFFVARWLWKAIRWIDLNSDWEE